MNNEMISILLCLGICLVLFLLIACILVWVGRKCAVITTFFLYCLIASGAYLVAANAVGTQYLNFYGNIGTSVDTICEAFARPFMFLYLAFTASVTDVCSLMMKDTSALVKFFNENIYFFVGLQAGLFILCALIFRKKKKEKIQRSRYCD